MSSDCPFCCIVSGSASSSIVYEDENILAFMDFCPISIGHTLIVPRKHWETIYEVPEKTLAELAAVVKKVCVAVKKTVDAAGIRIVQLNGKAAGQVVMHLHFHVIPVYSKDGVKIGYHKRVTVNRTKLDDIAKKIRENL